MRCTRFAAIAVASLAVAASAIGQSKDPNKIKDQLTGDARAPASANPQCKLFTTAEMSAFVGVPVRAGENAAGGSGCHWSDKSDEASGLVQVVPARYFAPPSAMKGYKRLPDIGTKAYVAPDMGWSAGAVVGEDAIVVVLSGKAASEASAVKLLQETIKRRKP